MPGIVPYIFFGPLNSYPDPKGYAGALGLDLAAGRIYTTDGSTWWVALLLFTPTAWKEIIVDKVLNAPPPPTPPGLQEPVPRGPKGK